LLRLSRGVTEQLTISLLWPRPGIERNLGAGIFDLSLRRFLEYPFVGRAFAHGAANSGVQFIEVFNCEFHYETFNLAGYSFV